MRTHGSSLHIYLNSDLSNANENNNKKSMHFLTYAILDAAISLLALFFYSSEGFVNLFHHYLLHMRAVTNSHTSATPTVTTCFHHLRSDLNKQF